MRYTFVPIMPWPARLPNPRVAAARVKLKRRLRRAGFPVDPMATTTQLISAVRALRAIER